MSEKSPRLIKFDFHSHTSWSDGLDSPQNMAKAAYQAGLDFYAYSDHNEPFTPTFNSLTSMELSTLNGHYLLVNLTDNLEIEKLLKRHRIPEKSCGAIISPRAKREFFEATHSMGGLVIAAHPGYGYMSAMPNSIIKAHDKGLIDGTEIHNHDVYQILTKKFKCIGKGIYKIWHEYVKRMFSKHMTMYAFSDAHRAKRLGKTFSEVDLPEEYPLTALGLISYLKSSQPKINHVAENYEPYPYPLQ